MAAVCSWLEVRKDWLLILDDFDPGQPPDHGLESVQARSIHDCLGYIPFKGEGSVLFTTSSYDMVKEFVDEDRSLELDRMNEHQAVQLLNSICGLPTTTEDSEHTSMLVSQLEGHPLSIRLAAMYVEYTGISKQEYAKLLEEKNEWYKSLATESSVHYRHGTIFKSVLLSWRVTIDYLSDHDPLACQLLQVMAHWHDTKIPRPLILAAWMKIKHRHRHRCTQGGCISADAALELLQELGLICLSLDDQAIQCYDFPKMIHEMMQDKTLLGGDSQKSRAGETAVAALMYQIGPRLWELSSIKSGEGNGMYLHVMSLFQRAELWSNRTRSFDRLKKAAAWLTSHRRLCEAQALLTQALHMSETMERREKRRGEIVKRPSDLDTFATVDVLERLAVVCEQRARYIELRRMLKRLVRARRRLLGMYHASTLDATVALATYYGKHGKPEEEAKLKYQTLLLRTKGSRHGKAGEPELVSYLIKLFDELGQHNKAEEMKLCFLEHCKMTWGHKHERTASAWAKLGREYHNRKRYPEAEGIQSFVVELRKELYGEKNVNTISSLEDLASTYEAQKKHAEHDDIVIEVYETYAGWLGEIHPTTVISKLPVGMAQFRQKRYDEAESTFDSIMSSGSIVLGDVHPIMLTCLSFLGRIYLEQGRLPLAKRTLAMVNKLEESRLGESAHQTLTTKFYLGTALLRQNQILKAKEIFEDIRPRQESCLGPTHLDTLKTTTSLGVIHIILKQHDDLREPAIQLRARCREAIENKTDGLHADLHRLTLETGEEWLAERTSDPVLNNEEDSDENDIVIYTPSPSEGTSPNVSEL